MNLKFHQVSTLPVTLDADAFYFVLNGDYAESYLTDNNGVAKMIGNSVMINELIQAAFNATNHVVADITARDAISPADVGDLALVTDATADTTVDAGAATYVYDGTAWVKISEYESLDVVVDWSDIQNGPSSTPAAIDAAVANSHTHANLTVLDQITNAGSGQIITAAERTAITHTNRAALDKIGEDADGCMTYDGTAIDKWATNNW